MYLAQVSRKLCQLESSSCHVIVRLYNISPGRQARRVDLHRERLFLSSLQSFLVVFEHQAPELTTHLVCPVGALNGADSTQDVFTVHEHALCAF
ncbi:hypothetical protein A0130_06175 [Leifsonia xyli]|nr:hypothetical protein A0130_06175 [Leifsonia xyli]